MSLSCLSLKPAFRSVFMRQLKAFQATRAKATQKLQTEAYSTLKELEL